MGKKVNFNFQIIDWNNKIFCRAIRETDDPKCFGLVVDGVAVAVVVVILFTYLSI